MSRGRVALVASLVATAVAVGWVLFVGLPRWTSASPPPPAPVAATAAPAEPAPKIRARLYYLAEDGLHLQSADREVLVGSSTVDQARNLIDALLEPAPEPLLSVIPSATKLRNIYITPEGVAFVDLSGEVRSGHSGGALAELFTVYSVVNTLADNLPAVTAVQILIDGREADTLAGHVDLRRPLPRSARWVEAPGAS
jgi:spore germination protein GerM